MAMEQRVTTLEEVNRLVIGALRETNEAMQRYNQSMLRYEEAAAIRDEAIRGLTASLERLEEANRESAAASERLDSAVQALLAFVPITQAEVVRLGSRIDNIEGA